MTRRSLWQMADNEIFELREAAHQILTDLYLEHTHWLTYVNQCQDGLASTKKSSPQHEQWAHKLRSSLKRLDEIEQRLSAQKSFCQALDNEYQHRNPPFWTAQELERMKRRR